MKTASEIKLLEIRDEGTCIPAFAFDVMPGQDRGPNRAILRRAGWGMYQKGIYVGTLQTLQLNYNSSKWTYARTMRTAHDYIKDNWDNIQSGDTIDVSALIGEEPLGSDLTY